jgi:hypothetical protein
MRCQESNKKREPRERVKNEKERGLSKERGRGHEGKIG